MMIYWRLLRNSIMAHGSNSDFEYPVFIFPPPRNSLSSQQTNSNLSPASGGASERVPTPVALLIPYLSSLCLCVTLFLSSGYACGSDLGFRSVDSSAREGFVAGGGSAISGVAARS
ncbi:hypothetical protein Rs2_45875 [Raphanus sativus]|nr:hypothetical protein Rs2_52470 [Raphanus sativus]KAJ4872449.1 hypothetical protein Rs2_45875 [Raphanus sativus]